MSVVACAVSCSVAPVLTLNAILAWATTAAPSTVSPESLMVCVDVENTFSLPSRG